MSVPLLVDIAATGGAGLLWTALVLGVRHGFDWDHIAAITDVTSTSTAADAAEVVHEAAHAAPSAGREAGATLEPTHVHGHGGPAELAAHAHAVAHAHAAHLPDPASGPGRASWAVPADGPVPVPPEDPPSQHRHVAVESVHPGLFMEERRALGLGTLYALGHASVVAALGILALAFGAVLPSWVDPIMARVVGVTLVMLGVWVFISLYQYVRHGQAFRLRSRWMLVFDGVRFAWRRFQARLHGHEHADPMEMTAYGPKTAFGVGMIHGIGAETGTQVLLIAAIGGASSQGLGLPMLASFIVGLLISNSIVVVITATGFIASRVRERLYIVIGLVAGTFSLVIGLLFLLELEGRLPAISAWLESIGIR